MQALIALLGHCCDRALLAAFMPKLVKSLEHRPDDQHTQNRRGDRKALCQFLRSHRQARIEILSGADIDGQQTEPGRNQPLGRRPANHRRDETERQDQECGFFRQVEIGLDHDGQERRTYEQNDVRERIARDRRQVRHPQRLSGLTPLSHGIPIKRGHKGIGRAWRVEQDCRHSAADGCAFHDADQETHDRQQSTLMVAKNRNQDR